jgi:RND family efflux transporter MFP subunit
MKGVKLRQGFAIALMAGAGLAQAAECLIEPMQTVEVASSVPGVVMTLGAQRGDRVKRGQVLVTLDDRAERAAMNSARFRAGQTGPAELAARKIEFAPQRFDRRSSLAREHLIAAQESDDAEAELRLAESELKVANENRTLARIELEQHTVQMNLRTIRSPIDGVVVEQMVRAGESVEAAGGKRTVFKIAQIHPLRVHVVLPKDLFGQVKPGDLVMITLENPISERTKTVVKKVDRVINASSGSFVAWLELPNPEMRIPAGIRCVAEIGNR